MMPHDLFAMYSAKAIEYLIAVAFLVLFIPFWRFVSGRSGALEVAVVARRGLVPRLAEWFVVPEGVSFHPGHAWARVEPDGHVAVGMSDFARKLVGQPSEIRLPAAGARVGQGEPGWTLLAGDRAIDMLSPVDGTVVEVNEDAFEPGAPLLDPYGDGWLLKVKPARLDANLKNLLAGETARRWTEQAADKLRARLSPDAGLVYQDGGVPVDGIARSLEPERWDELAKEFFLTKEGD